MPVISGPITRTDGQILQYNFGNLINSSYICNMKKETIKGVIDGKIIQSFSEGKDISVIQKELQSKTERFTEILMTNAPGADFDELSKNWESIDNVKVRYCVFYIIHCRQRSKDLDWMIKNRNKFIRYPDNKLFKIIKFKEKLSC